MDVGAVEPRRDEPVEEVLSPELVLVSPDLRERALVSSHTATGPSFSRRESVPVPACVSAPRRLRPTRTALLAALTATVGVLMILSLEITNEQPARQPRPAPPVFPLAGGFLQALPQPRTAPSSGGRQSKSRASAPVTRRRAATSKRAVTQKRAVAPSSAAAPTETGRPGVRPIAGGGYVLEGGTFRVSRDGRKIASLSMQTGCGSQIVLSALPVDRRGAFSFHSATVELRGRFVSRRQARGQIRILAGGCAGHARSFLASLS